MNKFVKISVIILGIIIVTGSVMISSKYNKGEFSLNIPVNGRDVNNIHLTDDKTTKVIYSK